MKEVKAYRCDFCQKTRLTKSIMKKHEERCFFNYKSKSCVTCRNFIPFENSAEDRHCTSGKDLKFRLETNCTLYQQG